MKRLTSIRSVLISAFTLSLLLPVLAMMLYAHLITGRVLANRALERQQHEVTLQAQHIEQSLNQIRIDASYLANLPSLQRAQSDVANIGEFEQDLLVFSRAEPMILRLLYQVDESLTLGIDNSTPTPRIIDSDVMLGPEYQAFFAQYNGMNSSQFAVSFDFLWDVPVLRYSLRFDNGTLIIDVLASWVLRNMPGIEENSLWAILNQNGHHILFPLRTEDYSGAIPATDAAIAQYLNQFHESESSAFDAESNTYIYSWIYPTNDRSTYWLLYRQMPQSALYGEVNDFYRTGIIVLILAIFVALGLGALISRQIIQPLIELKRKVSHFAQGLPVIKTDHPLRLSELNELHQSFYQMAEQLEDERKQKRDLIKKLINAQEDERKRIAYDLHDGLIQQLVVAKMYLAMLREAGNENSELNKSEEALKQAVIEGRRMIEGLHPTVLDDLGLVDAIAEIAHQQAERFGWTLDLQLETLPYTPDKTVSISTFRIVQEALNNIGKHAQADHVAIRLSNGDNVKLKIEDNGIGFDVDDVNQRAGLGIGTMRERAGSLNGCCLISSTPNKGTTILLELPYK